jgi:hypothetical protein
MSNRYDVLHDDAPSVVTERTWAYSAYGAFPVNHGSVRLIESAGILIGAIFTLMVSSPEAPSPPAPGELGSFAFVNVMVTGRQCLPERASVETFDHTTELPLNDRLVASSNS